jgi:dTDP-4-amino-4,6-dideoxygalactose transaminase
VESAIIERTKAILPVHLHGQLADLDAILEIARRRGLLVIEDAAQAHGAEYKGHRVGAIGDMGCFSFYPRKNLGAYGEDGMVITNDETHAEKIRFLGDWGQARKYHHVHKGFNYRMEGLQGAVLRVKLRCLEECTEARRANAARYDELLADSSAFGLPVQHDYARHGYHVYAVRVPSKDAVQEALSRREIQTGIHYPIPVHLQQAYSDLGYTEGDLPITEQSAAELLSVLTYPELTSTQIKEVCEALLEKVERAQ